MTKEGKGKKKNLFRRHVVCSNKERHDEKKVARIESWGRESTTTCTITSLFEGKQSVSVSDVM